MFQDVGETVAAGDAGPDGVEMEVAVADVDEQSGLDADAVPVFFAELVSVVTLFFMKCFVDLNECALLCPSFIVVASSSPLESLSSSPLPCPFPFSTCASELSSSSSFSSRTFVQSGSSDSATSLNAVFFVCVCVLLDEK